MAVPKDSYAFGAPAGWAVVTRNDPAAAVAAIQQLEKEHPAAKGLLQQIAQAFDPSQESTGSAYLLRFEGSSMQQIPIWVDVPTKSDPATFAKQTAEGITTSLKELGVTTVVKTSTVENVPPIVRLEYTRAPGRVVVQYMVLGAKHLYTVNGDTKLDSLAQQVAKSLQELP